MWDLKPDAPDGIRSQFKPIRTNAAGVEISDQLPHIARVADKLTIVRSVTHNSDAHEVSVYRMLTGQFDQAHQQWLTQGAFHRNGVVLGADRIQAAEDLDAVIGADIGLYRRRQAKNAVPVLTKDLQQGGVVEFADDIRLPVLGGEPGVEAAPE